MRSLRWLLLTIIAAILATLGVLYQRGRDRVDAAAPAKPDPLPKELSGKAQKWHWVESDEGKPKVEIWAEDFKQDAASSRVELTGMRLHLFHKDGAYYDRVESPSAVFQPTDQNLFSESYVTITMGVPTTGAPARQLVSIKTSGVTYQSTTGKATTEREAEFTFENGVGRSKGAVYDPVTRELLMKSAVVVDWRGNNPKARPMRIESESLIYKERESNILLYPWARLTRDSGVLNGGDTIVTLADGEVRTVESQKATGRDQQPGRALNYSADKLTATFRPGASVEQIVGEGNARMESSTPLARTLMTTNRADLDFAPTPAGDVLTRATGHGKSVVESRPADAVAQPKPDTRILKSDVIEMKMRPGGEEIDEVLTHTPGTLDFLPNRPTARKRSMTGERMWITYGERNVVRKFRSVDVTTRTEPLKPADPPQQTASKNLEADFDAKGIMTRLKQWDNFTYTEGKRQAVAATATQDPATNIIRLETSARVWDDSGSTSADTIVMNQTSGESVAEGKVSSIRKQEKGAKGSAIFSGSEPVRATARTMHSFDGNARIVYEGSAVMWQGANRVRGDRIEIEREAGRLVATGKVETQLLEKSKNAFTTVQAANLVYTDDERLAHYTGGSRMTRPDLKLDSLELRAWLKESAEGEASALDRAVADGKVVMLRTTPGRTRKGNSEHADYFTGEEKIVLRGGRPVFEDSLKGATTGDELTYFSADDRLLVNGAPARQAASRIRKK